MDFIIAYFGISNFREKILSGKENLNVKSNIALCAKRSPNCTIKEGNLLEREIEQQIK